MFIQHDGDDVEPHRRGVAGGVEDDRGRVYREETPLGIGVGTRTDVAVDELAPEDAVARYEDSEKNQQKQQKPHAAKKLKIFKHCADKHQRYNTTAPLMRPPTPNSFRRPPPQHHTSHATQKHADQDPHAATETYAA